MSSKTTTSYGSILRSSAIIGSATIVVLFTNLLKVKIVAVLLGPAGVGMIGLLQKLIALTSMIAALGIDAAGTRRIALAQQGGASPDLARRSLFWGVALLSVAGAVALIAASGQLAHYVLENPDQQLNIAWLALGVAASVMATYHTALFTGLRQMGAIARIRAYGGILSAIIGIVAVWCLGQDGIILLIVATPLATLAVGYFSLFSLPPASGPRPSFRAMLGEWRSMVGSGTWFMLSGLICVGSELTMRTLIQRELGLEMLGQFQAAWAIGVAYMTLTISAMGADFLPRLTGALDDKPLATRLINEQTEVALLVCGPCLLALIAFAPSVLWLLYSEAFTPVAAVLRVQLLADVLKILAWPLSLALMAAGRGRGYFFIEFIGSMMLVLVVAAGLSRLGLMATGLAYVVVYATTLPLLFILARRRIGFGFSRVVVRDSVMLLLAALIIVAASTVSEPLAAVSGGALASAATVFSIVRIRAMSDLTHRSARLASLLNRFKLSRKM